MAVVDPEDFAAVSQFNWHIVLDRGRRLAARNVRGADGKYHRQYLHQFILGATNITSKLATFMNDDALDCRRSNIRITDRQRLHGRCRNRELGCGKFTSQYKGVSFDRSRGLWRAVIQFEKRYLQIGRFETEIEAARAYNETATQLFGEFARINKIPA
jgi:hypothetical protein